MNRVFSLKLLRVSLLFILLSVELRLESNGFARLPARGGRH